MKVVKFGGSSLANGEQIKKVFNIVTSDKDRKIVVVSAPGKRFDGDVKVTDLLIDCVHVFLKDGGCYEQYQKVISRYEEICEQLNLTTALLTEIKNDLTHTIHEKYDNELQLMDAVMACGEKYCAQVVAAYFQSQQINTYYINPKEAGLYVTSEPNNAQVLPNSYERLFSLRQYEGVIIFPGFFGYSKEGKVVTFPRSGSDITGSVLANGVKADIYENFTDVDAVYSVNPTIIDQPKEIKEITYREMRELSYAGFGVFHDEALRPAFQAGIPVNIKNTNNPSASGTFIVKERIGKNGPVSGIASDKGFCSLYVSKYLMNREIGFGRQLLQILEDYGISYEHSPSGIDDISVIMSQKLLTKEVEAEIVRRIYDELQADDIVVEHDLALIMIVGQGMRHNVGTTARAANALAKASINIEMINQGSSEVSMMFGIKESDEKKAVRALYEEFFIPTAACTL
ncbi:MAG: aspartate kinase [Bacillaceae bacterium]